MAEALKLLTIVGARPQIIKAAALGRAIQGPFAGRIHQVLLHTGQHYDAGMSQVFFDEMGIAAPDHHLGVGSGTHGTQTARMLEGIEAVIMQERPHAVLVYGDTNSTLAGALAAAKLHVPLVHVEAGLRSFNKAMPEEVNRVVCDHCSTWLFCPTQAAVDNLLAEGFHDRPGTAATIDSPRLVHCGDVMLDNTRWFTALSLQRSAMPSSLGLADRPYALVTIHRDHNTDDPKRLSAIFEALLMIRDRQGLAIVLPLHPRTRKCMATVLSPALRGRLESDPGLVIIDPAGYMDMLALEHHARLIITDSGGVQKEAYFMGRPCVILRAETEWVELVEAGHARLCDADPGRIVDATGHYLDHGLPPGEALYGDGRAAERICSELLADHMPR